MKPLYKSSIEEAIRNNEKEECIESLRENVRCRDFLDNEIREKFDGMYLPDECAENTVKEFGYDRTMWVIANSVQQREGDGRFHRENQDWAKKLNIPKSDWNYDFALRSHSTLVDSLAGQVQKMYQSLNLLDNGQTIQSAEPQDYTGKLLIIRADVLKEEFRTPENQLFLASGGFGCKPDARGRKVFGQFLSDGEKTQFYREDFEGVIDEKHIPQWAKDKMAQMQQQSTAENSAENRQAEECVEADAAEM